MSVLGFDQWIQIRRELPAGSPDATGTQDPTTGVFTPAETPDLPDYFVIYDGKADVQDKPIVMVRDQVGQPVETADGVIYLKDETKTKHIKPDDIVVVTYADGEVRDAEVTQVRRVDGAIFVVRL